jgi:hypothetical protein
VEQVRERVLEQVLVVHHLVDPVVQARLLRHLVLQQLQPQVVQEPELVPVLEQVLPQAVELVAQARLRLLALQLQPLRAEQVPVLVLEQVLQRDRAVQARVQAAALVRVQDIDVQDRRQQRPLQQLPRQPILLLIRLLPHTPQLQHTLLLRQTQRLQQLVQHQRRLLQLHLHQPQLLIQTLEIK